MFHILQENHNEINIYFSLLVDWISACFIPWKSMPTNINETTASRSPTNLGKQLFLSSLLRCAEICLLNDLTKANSYPEVCLKDTLVWQPLFLNYQDDYIIPVLINKRIVMFCFLWMSNKYVWHLDIWKEFTVHIKTIFMTPSVNTVYTFLPCNFILNSNKL